MTEFGTQAHLVLEATAVMKVVVAASPMDHLLGTFGVKQMDDALAEDLTVRNSLYLHFQSLFFFFSSPAPNPANRSFLSLARIWRTQERLVNRVRFFLSMPSKLPEYSFESSPNDRALATAGSVLTIGLSIKGCSHSKNQFGERKKID